jgi:hypothetical protein
MAGFGGRPALDPGRGEGADGDGMARTPADHLDLFRLAGLLVDPDAAHGGLERPADQGSAPDRVADPDEVPSRSELAHIFERGH